MKKLFSTLVFALLTASVGAQHHIISITANQPGKQISPDLFGVFFEDINYAADGGLYAELIQNRSFEYSATEQIGWNAFTSWEFTTRDGGHGSVKISDAVSVHANNPHYAVLETDRPGAGLMNSGFDGIPVAAGERYDFSASGRQLFTGSHWGSSGKLEHPARLVARLETKDHIILGESTVEISGREWQRVSASILATNSDTTARFVLLSQTKGSVALDEISLFPHQTFKNRPNGLRADLAQAIADLHPKFVRFPGGCLVHGHGLGNMYRWKDSIGPIEHRRGQENLWGYHQSVGLGYFEYFQFCEDIGAKMLPVVPAAVCCQNADDQGGTGQRGLSLNEMSSYIQDVLDLIEWANGPTNSTWGAKRAAAGHPEPFHLEYLGIGNEDHITPVFQERFKMIHDVVKSKHPEITIVGTVGPFHSGEDFETGWKIANELNVAMVDEHYYEKPEWFLNNLQRYDGYDRAKSKVYVGEYAAHDDKRVNTLRSALAEAAFLTALERNGDVVRLSSYAPLLAKQGHTQWRPDMIYFDNSKLLRSVNYYVQQMFAQNSGDEYLPVNVPFSDLAVSSVRDSKSGDVIIKLVNLSTNVMSTQLKLDGIAKFNPVITRLVLTGSLGASNSFSNPESVVPVRDLINPEDFQKLNLPASSLTVLRLKQK